MARSYVLKAFHDYAWQPLDRLFVPNRTSESIRGDCEFPQLALARRYAELNTRLRGYPIAVFNDEGVRLLGSTYGKDDEDPDNWRLFGDHRLYPRSRV